MTSRAEEPHNAAISPSWRPILEACEALDPEDAAWETVDQFVDAVSTLANLRLAERERVRHARREAVAAARARLTSVVASVRSAPGCERVTAEIDRVLAGAISHERALDLAESSVIFGTAVAEVTSVRSQLVERVQSGAPAVEMEPLVHDLRARESEQTSRLEAILALLATAGAESSPYDDGPVRPEPEPEPAPVEAAAPMETAPPPPPEPEPEPAPAPVVSSNAPRVWLSREEAEARYPNPVAALTAPGALPDGIATLWSEQDHKKAIDRDRLRRAFFEACTGEAGASLAHVESKFIRVDLDALRSRLEADGNGPARAAVPDGVDALVLTSAPLSEGLGAPAFVRNLLELAASEGDERAIRVFLAPRLPASHRKEAFKKFGSGGIFAVVLDDVDACRLLAPGDAPAEGLDGTLNLVAIVSEQMNRER